MDYKKMAQQLRKPEGYDGVKIGDFMHKGNSSFYHNLSALLPTKAQDTILEIGMGNGKHVVEHAYLQHCNYFAADYSPTMVEACRKNNPQFKNQIFYTSADNLPFTDHHFDWVFTVNTIYFWEDALKELQEIHRVLKMKGTFILAKRTVEDLITLSDITRHGFINYPNSIVEDLLQQAGFKLQKRLVLKENPTKVNGRSIQLHNAFYICQKLSVCE